MEIYVSKESRGGDGTKEYPLNSLAQAAIIAKPGDEVIFKVLRNKKEMQIAVKLLKK